MQIWEYREVIQVRDSKTGKHYWSDHRNWTMHPIIRLARESEGGWELASAYPLDNDTRIIYTLKRRVDWNAVG
jgi:hypothetical protein